MERRKYASGQGRGESSRGLERSGELTTVKREKFAKTTSLLLIKVGQFTSIYQYQCFKRCKRT